MPRISRVRIVNVNYNNNNRQIGDEIFDFYGGEHALFNLANGGGKTIIIQAMLQAIIPKVKLLQRKAHGFLQKSGSPAIILIEWKLDNNSTYLLSGISMCLKADGSGEKSGSESIDYFTFGYEYKETNNCDIGNISLIEMMGEQSLRVKKHKEIKEYLKGQKKKGINLHLFDDDSEGQRSYGKFLKSYGIYREEWKELVVKINETESGISNFFSSCNSSKQLMEQWILKYIEKVLEKTENSDKSSHKKLEEMAINVVNSLEENDAQINEAKALKETVDEFENINIELKSLTEKLGEKNRRLKELNGIYKFLEEKSIGLNTEKHRLEVEISGINVEKRIIDLEEQSDKYYRYIDEMTTCKLELESLDEELQEINHELDEIKKEIIKLDGVRHYKKYSLQYADNKLLEEKIKNQEKNSKELQDELERIRYSIKVKLEREKESIVLEKSKIDEDVASFRNEKTSGRRQIVDLDFEIAALSKKNGMLEDVITKFEMKENKVLEELAIPISRNLITNLLDTSDKEKGLLSLKNENQEIQQSISKINDEILDIKDQLKVGQKNLRELELYKRDSENSLNKLLESLKGFRKIDNEISLLGKKHDISRKNSFDLDELKNKLKKELDSFHSRKSNTSREISEIRQFIENLDLGKSYIPASLLNLIEKNNLEVITGEQYLNNNSNVKNQLLENIPLLPYSLILSKDEKTSLQSLIEKENLTQVIPIYDFNQLNGDYKTNENSFFYNPKLVRMDKTELEEYKEEKRKSKIELKAEQERMKESIESLNSELSLVDKFDYRELDVKEWQDQVTKYYENEDVLKERILTQEAAIVEREKRLTLLEDSRKKAEENFRRVVKKQQLFDEYLNEDLIYVANKEGLDLCRRDLINKNQEKSSIEKKIEKLDSAINDSTKLLERLNNNIMKVDERLKEYLIAEMFEEDKDTLENLIIREKALKERDNDFRVLNDSRIKGDRDLEYIEDSIKGLGFSIEEAKELIVLKTKDELDVQLKDFSIKKQEIEASRNKKFKDFSNLEGKIDLIKNQLGEMLISREKIKYNFENRIRDLEIKELEKKSSIRVLELDTNKISIIIAKLEDILDKRVKDTLIINFGENYISEIEAFILGLKESNEELREDTRAFEQMVRKKIDKLKRSNSETVLMAYTSFNESFVRLNDSYEPYYYLLELTEKQIHFIKEILKIYDGKLKEIENLKKDLIRHCFLDAMKVYYEIDKIGENSSIDFNGTKRKMLEIKYNKIEDEEVVKLKMESYVEDLLRELKTKVKELEENRLIEYVERAFSFKELLNVASSLESFVVKAYKIDINENNRRMVPWEAVNKDNSGGERFVAYFSILAALISYTRKKDVSIDVFSKKELGKVLIMDNPFGPITSRHLLEPMFEIADKYNMQLICFSDIKQNAIYDNFKLIYMIKVSRALSGKEFLETNKIKSEGFEQEKLESAFIYTPKGTQKELF